MRWLGLALVVFGAAVFLWVDPHGERARTDRRDAPAEPDGPANTGRADRGLTSAPELPIPGAPSESARSGGAEVLVRVLDRASGEPLPRARVEVEAAPILTEEQLREFAVRPPTASMEELGYFRDVANADARGEATFRVVPPSRLDVWGELEGYLRAYREGVGVCVVASWARANRPADPGQRLPGP